MSLSVFFANDGLFGNSANLIEICSQDMLSSHRKPASWRKERVCKPLKGFIAYSHRNTEAKDELRRRLAVMGKQNELITWHDGDLTAGDKASQENILKHLADSDLLIYLVSADSLASKNCNKELAEALGLEMRVIPIILESCDWLNHQLQNFEALPDKGVPINEWHPESKGWQNVVDGLRKAVNETRARASNAAEKETLLEWVFQHGNFLLGMLREIEMAIEAYSHAIDLNPEHADAYNNRGVAYLYKGKFDLAIADFNIAVKLAPDFEIPYVNRGDAYSGKGNVDRAIENFNTALALNPSCAEGYNNRGIAYCNIGEFDKALNDFNTAIELNPDDFIAYNNRGNVYRRKSEINNAIGDFNTALTLKPDYADAYHNRGDVYGNEGSFDRALKDLNMAIELDSRFAEAYNSRGSVYHKTGESEKAIADFNTAIELKPDYAKAYYNRGNLYGKTGDADKAIADLSKAIKLNADFADAYYDRGVAYGKNRAFDRAIADYTKAIELSSDNTNKAYCNRGAAYFCTGEFDLALEDYTTALGINPHDTLVYFNRALVWLCLQNWNKAKADLVAAERRGLDVSELFHTLYKSVADFERIIDAQLPADIKAMLAPQ